MSIDVNNRPLNLTHPHASHVLWKDMYLQLLHWRAQLL